MKQAVEVPQVGESVTSGIIAVWNVEDGAMVQEGDELFELETDKATLPVPSPATGAITIKIPVDEEVEIGMVVAEIDTEVAGSDPGSSAAGGEAQSTPAKEESKDTAPVSESAGAAAGDSAPVSPAVRRVLEEHGLTADVVAAGVAASGKDGRLTKADVESYLAKGGTASGTGAATPKNAAAPAVATIPGGQERKRMTKLRQTIAANLVSSKQQSAHLTTFNEVDMGAVMDLRKQHKDQFEQRHGVRLGFMSFFVKAAQRALAEFPAVNAFVDGTEIIYNYFYNVGVAISTDAGLLVPVLRNVDSMTFADIESSIVDFAQRARARRLLPDEFAGGTFTITNGGVFGSMLSTPIPSPPQTAILGMHSINKRAVVIGDDIVVRPMMYLALTYDHRIIDGREAIGFLNRIKAQIEDPTQMLLET